MTKKSKRFKTSSENSKFEITDDTSQVLLDLVNGIRDLEDKFLKQWPGSANVYLPGGKAAKVGQVIVNSALAGMLDYLKSKEKSKTPILQSKS